MSEDGGDKGGFEGDKGSASGGEDFFGGGGGGGDWLADPASGGGNWDYAAPDLGNLDYLTGGSGTGGGYDPGDGIGGGGFDTGAGAGGFDPGGSGAGGGGAGGPTGWVGDTYHDPNAYAPGYYFNNADGSWQSVNPPTTQMPGSTPQIGEPGHAFSADAFLTQGPAGSSGAPDVNALNTAPLNTGIPTLGAPTGPSAVGGSDIGGASGSSGGGDLSAAKKDGGFLDKLSDGITKNPLGTALAAGGLGYNMLQSKSLANQLQGPTGRAPAANLAELAAPAMQTGRELTDEGRGIIRTGVDDLRTRATATDPNMKTLLDRGTGLTGYVGTGKLPAELQTVVDQATSDAKRAVISRYASKGMPTDPAKNSSLRSELARIDRDAVTQGATLAQQLATSGLSMVDSSGRLNSTSGGFQNQAGNFGTNMVNSGISASGLASQTYANLARIDDAQTERTQKAIAAMAAALSGQSVSNSVNNVARTV